MNNSLFCNLTSSQIALLIDEAKESICFAGPGIQLLPAQAICRMSKLLGPEMITLSIDFDERVLRMGYGDVEAVKALKEAGININHAPGLRSALIIVDEVGFSFTPTALYLEAEPDVESIRNAMRLSPEQVSEALARLSPAAKAIAVAAESDIKRRERILDLPIEVCSDVIKENQLLKMKKVLNDAPPVKFDVARQVRVFESYLQYVEVKMTGAAIQRRRLSIPTTIQQLGSDEGLNGRLHTTFELIEQDGKLSSKSLENKLKKIRKDFTPSLGKDYGRVVLKSAKSHLKSRIEELKIELDKYKNNVSTELDEYLNNSRKQIIDYYFKRVIENPPDSLLGSLPHSEVTDNDARNWINLELDQVFPLVESLIGDMKIVDTYKDVTFETLNQSDFLSRVKKAFKNIDWNKTYTEFKAAAEKTI